MAACPAIRPTKGEKHGETEPINVSPNQRPEIPRGLGIRARCPRLDCPNLGPGPCKPRNLEAYHPRNDADSKVPIHDKPYAMNTSIRNQPKLRP